MPFIDTQARPSATMWNITRLPEPLGRAPSSSLVGGDVYDHGSRKLDRKKIAPVRWIRSRTCGMTVSMASVACVSAWPLGDTERSGVSVTRDGVLIMDPIVPPMEIRCGRHHGGSRPCSVASHPSAEG